MTTSSQTPQPGPKGSPGAMRGQSGPNPTWRSRKAAWRRWLGARSQRLGSIGQISQKEKGIPERRQHGQLSGGKERGDRWLVMTVALAAGGKKLEMRGNGEAARGWARDRRSRVINTCSGLEQGRAEARKPVRGHGTVLERDGAGEGRRDTGARKEAKVRTWQLSRQRGGSRRLGFLWALEQSKTDLEELCVCWGAGGWHSNLGKNPEAGRQETCGSDNSRPLPGL